MKNFEIKKIARKIIEYNTCYSGADRKLKNKSICELNPCPADRDYCTVIHAMQKIDCSWKRFMKDKGAILHELCCNIGIII